MKRVYCVIVILMLFSIGVQAQKIPADAEAIELTATLADSVLFESVQSYLEEAGFDIDVANEEDRTLLTEYKIVTEFKSIREPVQIRLLATVENGVVFFKGQVSSVGSANGRKDAPIINREAAGGADDSEFLFVNEVVTRYAKTLDQATIDYIVP